MEKLEGSVVLVTGANGGLGTQFVVEALRRGASKVYATARTPRTWNDDRVIGLALDITDPSSVDRAVQAASDVTVLVNNAGISPRNADLLVASDSELHEIFETNFFGQVRMVRAFEPVPEKGPGRSAVIDMHSALSWHGSAGSYSATKAALWSATNSFRLALAPRGVQVIGVHVGWVDTPMAAGADGPKVDPVDVVRAAYDALTSGAHEVLVDGLSKRLKAGLAGPIELLYPGLTPPESR